MQLMEMKESGYQEFLLLPHGFKWFLNFCLKGAIIVSASELNNSNYISLSFPIQGPLKAVMDIMNLNPSIISEVFQSIFFLLAYILRSLLEFCQQVILSACSLASSQFVGLLLLLWCCVNRTRLKIVTN